MLGAGIQGVTVSLALARGGAEVDLVDRADGPLAAASGVGEGKIHLGHVYARDASLDTARTLLRAALRFAPLVDQLTGAPADWDALRSRPFRYVQLAGSLSDPAALAAHYDQVDALAAALDPGERVSYVGRPLVPGWSEIDVPTELDPARARWAASTPEVAVDVRGLRRHLVDGLDRCDAVDASFGVQVEEVERTAHGFRVAGARDGDRWSLDADVVVNCLWADRLRVDAQLDLRPAAPWVLRRKYRLLVELPDELVDLPSTTFVLGPFGDVVTWPGRRGAYVSWYPTCLRGWSEATTSPAAWQTAQPEEEADVVATTLQAVGQLLPGIERSTVRAVDAGAIFAWGSTDIDEPDSGLHTRAAIGPEVVDGYVSVNTGKLTAAPLFAEQVGRALLGPAT